MADTTVGSLTNVTTATIGSVAITGIQSINYSVPRALIPSPPADGEAFGGTPHQGACAAVTGTIVFSNQYTADAAGSLSGTLAATGTGMGGQANSDLQILQCVLGEPDATLAKDAPGTATISFMAGSEDGTTSPVSWS